MKFTPEFIAEARKLAEKATARPWVLDWNWESFNLAGRKYSAWAQTPAISGDSLPDVEPQVTCDRLYTEAAANNYPDALAEIERLREALDAATDAIAFTVACCTYGSEEQAKVGAYGISHEAFTKIDAFIRKYALDKGEALKGGDDISIKQDVLMDIKNPSLEEDDNE